MNNFHDPRKQTVSYHNTIKIRLCIWKFREHLNKNLRFLSKLKFHFNEQQSKRQLFIIYFLSLLIKEKKIIEYFEQSKLKVDIGQVNPFKPGILASPQFKSFFLYY